MNVNRQNNRCGTPPIVSCGNRPIGRPIGRPTPPSCPEVCSPSPNTTTVCQEECNVCVEPCNPCSDSCNACSDNTNSGIVIFGRVNACNKETILQGVPLAMAYVPWQPYENLYSISQAVQQGTIFKDLDFEFMGRRCN